METNVHTPFLRLEVIWRDEYMFELSVTASNDDPAFVGVITTTVRKI
jgi:hypothetical protein